MKRISTLLLITACYFTLSAQPGLYPTPTLLDYYKWSDPIAYKMSAPPKIRGLGPLSDSLSNMKDGITFYEINDTYIPIQSWADYYYWYTKKYAVLFHEPELYEYYYFAKNDYGMATYILGEHYLYDYWPSNFAVRFDDRPFDGNRLAEDTKPKQLEKDEFYKAVQRFERRTQKNQNYTSERYQRKIELQTNSNTTAIGQNKNNVTKTSYHTTVQPSTTRIEKSSDVTQKSRQPELKR